MPFWRLGAKFGPGLVTGASDDDPSGIATYTQAGAQFGFGLLWTALFTVPFMAAIQEASARLTIVTRRGLTENLLRVFPRWLVALGVGLFVAVNVFNLGADLGMMAASAQLLWGISQWIWLVCFVVITLVLQILLDYARYAKYLKWLCLSLLAYVVVAFMIRVEWFEVFRATFMPQIVFGKEYILMAVAVLGTTLSPYLYVWQSSQELEERHGDEEETLYRRRADVAVGMSLSNVVAWFIMLTAGSILFSRGLVSVETPLEAARVLAPMAGTYASWVFSIGVIGTGLLAVPVLSGSAAYAVSEFMGLKKYGLSCTWRQAPWFYAIIIALTVAGAATTAFGFNPIRALIYAAVGNALIAPVLILGIIALTENTRLMQDRVNGPVSRVLLWGCWFLMTGALMLWLWMR